MRFPDESEYLSSLLDDPRIHDIAAGILGDDFNYTTGDGNFYVGDTPWHSDGYDGSEYVGGKKLYFAASAGESVRSSCREKKVCESRWEWGHGRALHLLLRALEVLHQQVLPRQLVVVPEVVDLLVVVHVDVDVVAPARHCWTRW